MAVNQYVNKVVLNGTTIMDISDATATSADVAQGKYFYLPNGQKIQGAMPANVNIPSFGGCTDSELAEVLTDSSVNVYNDLGWRVGDMRKVSKGSTSSTWYIAKIETNTIYIFNIFENVNFVAEYPGSTTFGVYYSAGINYGGVPVISENAYNDLSTNFNHHIANVKSSLNNFYSTYVSGTILDTYGKSLSDTFHCNVYINKSDGYDYEFDYTINGKVMIMNKDKYDNKYFSLLNTYAMIPLSDTNVGDTSYSCLYNVNSNRYGGYWTAYPTKYTDKKAHTDKNMYNTSFTYNGVYMALNKA